MKRKEGMSFEAFRDYYENNHAPLAASLCPHLVKYTRTYITGWQPLARSAQLPEPGFDCITECWYDVEGTWDERKMDLLPAEVFKQLAADEENFLDRRANRMVSTELETSESDTLLGNRG
ncbi:MAG: EthD domain-containing protein [Novosphingobium sp.]|nr:EthD domain-containing protein [Novosphingobium sp.]